jgi:oligopeptide transport system substrate-binding protein
MISPTLRGKQCGTGRICLYSVLLFSCFFQFACKPRERAVDAGVRDQVLHIANGAEPQSLDPHIVAGIPEMNILRNVFEGLVELDPETLEPVPAAAERWEISEDGTKYTFYLRQNLKWSNGEALTARDFHYSLRRALSPKLATPYITFFRGIRNALEYNKGEVTNYDEVGCKVVDDHTLEIYLDHPHPVLLIYLAGQYFYPVHQATIEAYGDIDQRGTGWFRPGKIVSNGPFNLTDWGTNTLVSIEPNPHYWDREAVRLNKAHFYPIENLDTQYRSYRNGQVHIARNIPLHVIQGLEQTRPRDYRSNLYLGTYYYGFNVRKPPLNDPRVRRAFSLAIDRDQIINQVTEGGQKAATSFVPPGANKYKPDYTFSEDLGEAQALLAEAGFPGGEGFPTLEILFNTAENHTKIAEAVQQMWKVGLGVRIKLVNMEWKIYLDARDSGDFDIVRAGWVGGVDYAGYLDIFNSESGNNDTGWSNAKFDAFFRQASQIMDPELRMKTIQQAEEILLKEMPIAPIFHYTTNYLVDTRVKNWHSNVIDERTLKQVYLEE